MEIKVNKEVQNMHETIFMGLSPRQFICSVLAVAVAVGLYFCFRNVLGRETVSWVCIVAASPVAVAGFFQYNGMTFEQFAWAWIKSSFLLSGHRGWKAVNYYEELMKLEGGKKRYDKIVPQKK